MKKQLHFMASWDKQEMYVKDWDQRNREMAQILD